VLYEPRSVLFHLESQTEGRHAHEYASGARLARRWRHLSLADQVRVLREDGLVVRVRDLDDSPHAVLERLEGAEDEHLWQVAAEAERRAAEAGFTSVAPLLEDAAAWPGDPALLCWAAGELCPRAGVPERAAAFWARLLELEENAAARAALATDALEHGALDRAQKHVSRLLERRPDDARGLLVHGVLLLQREQFQPAGEAFRRAAVQGGDARRCALGLGMALLGAGESEEAWQTFADLVREHPDDAEAVHWLLRAGCVLERWRGLRAFLAESVARVPADPALRFALAGVQGRLGDLEAARGEYDTLRATAPAFDGLDSLAGALERQPLARDAARGA
jgi:thioredoxin-like negative regulator of GroEL